MKCWLSRLSLAFYSCCYQAPNCKSMCLSYPRCISHLESRTLSLHFNLSTSARVQRSTLAIASNELAPFLRRPSVCQCSNSQSKMRYQDWDILLFPEGSKVPIQEFKTQCHVTRDLGQSFDLLQSPVARSTNKLLDRVSVPPQLNLHWCSIRVGRSSGHPVAGSHFLHSKPVPKRPLSGLDSQLGETKTFTDGGELGRPP
jgi:hypothetical protein